MKPLKLEIEGLYSYRGRTVIDFETLTRGGLFGIFGPVGSGKSAILEAITFALYGETSRMNRNERSYNMMNLQSDRLFIDYQFQVRGEVYRFNVTANRNSKDFNDIRTPKRGCYRKKRDDWIPLEENVNDSAEKILGLNYLNFRRTIIIPQGKFQEFLQLLPGKRTEMLEELFNLERFNLYNRTSRLHSHNKTALANLSGQLSQMEGVTGAKVRELEDLKIKLAETQEKRKRRIEGLEIDDRDFARLKGLSLEIEKFGKELAGVSLKMKEAGEREAVLDRFEEARNLFALPVRMLREETDRLEQRRKELEESLEEEKLLFARRVEKDRVYDLFIPDFERKDEYLKTRENLNKLSELKTKESELSEIQTVIELEKKRADELFGRENELKNIRDEIRKKTVKIREILPPVSERTALQRWLDDGQRMEMESARSGKVLEELDSDIRKLDQEADELIRTSPFKADLLPAGSKGAALVPGLSGVLSELEEKLKLRRDELRNIQRHRELEARLAGLSMDLKPGDPCPLCGSTEHPGIDSGNRADPAGGVSAGRLAGDEDRADPDAVWESFGELRRRLDVLKSGKDALVRRKEDALNEAAALGRELESHQGAFRWQDFSTGRADEDQKLLEDFHKREKELHGLELRLDQIEEELRERSIETESKRSDLAVKSQELAGLTALTEALKEEIPGDFIKEKGGVTPVILEEEAMRLEDKLDGLEADLISLDREEKALLGLEAGLAQKLESRRSLAAEAESGIQTCKEELAELLDHSGFSKMDEVEEILNSDLSVEDERKEIMEIRELNSRLEHGYSGLKKELGDSVYSAKEHDEHIRKLESMKNEWKEDLRKGGEVEGALKDIREKLTIKKRLMEERKKLMAREENLKTLFSLFKARGFVNYVSTLYLRELVEGANRRFQVLCGRSMQLELKDDNSFVVRDFLNSGKLRSVKTLSGGQTFLASFSLALALADSVNAGNRQTGEEGFFFLDEGFGSLDKDSLRIVMEALWSLGREKRVVGVISHVEEMQEEIPSYILVSRDEESGSRIVPGWA